MNSSDWVVAVLVLLVAGLVGLILYAAFGTNTANQPANPPIREFALGGNHG